MQRTATPGPLAFRIGVRGRRRDLLVLQWLLLVMRFLLVKLFLPVVLFLQVTLILLVVLVLRFLLVQLLVPRRRGHVRGDRGVGREALGRGARRGHRVS